MDLHDEKVAHLSAQVKLLHKSGTSFRIHHGSTNSTRTTRRNADEVIDTSNLNKIIRIDVAARTCLVEPNVAFDDLVDATLECGLMPLVVPEFPKITVGGAFVGTAGESSSWKYGFFDRTVNWFEIILASGELVVASDQEHHDLFRGAAGTFGTLGVCTLFEVRLVKAKKGMELTYFPVESVSDAQRHIRLVTKDLTTEIDFVDGIMFSKTSGVIMHGKIVNFPSKPATKIQTFSKAADPWFYLHAQEKAKEPSPYTELVPIKDYLFRYDRGCFWTGTLAFEYFMLPFNAITRWLLDYLMHARIMYHALHRSGLGQQYIIQDLMVPNENAEDLISYLDKTVHAYPLWLCPLIFDRCGLNSRSLASTSKGMPLLNIGVWCESPIVDFISINRRIEAKLNALDGLKWLYAQTFYTEREFWNIYDREQYDGLRKAYGAQALPSVYEKVKTDVEADKKRLVGIWSVWPLAGIYGVLSAIKGGNYLTK
jgi:delta24-sterol reductase